MRSKIRDLSPYLPGAAALVFLSACLWILAGSPVQGRLRAALVVVLTIVLVASRFFGSRSDENAPRDPSAPDPSALDPSALDPMARQALLGAAACWSLCLPLVFYLYQSSATAPQPAGWNRYPYLDTRWLIVLFWSTVPGLLWLPHVLLWLRRLVETDAPETDAPETDELASSTVPIRRRHGLRLLLAFVVATFFFGPPWNVPWSAWPVNPHETLHWGGLQSIDRGHTPYVGPASVNYGPGAQLAMYAYVDATDQMTISGIRETFAVALWLAVFLYCAVVMLALPPPQAAVAVVLMLVVSPVAGWSWQVNGVLVGFFGWANLLRNIATLVLSFAVYGLVRLGLDRRTGRVAAFLVGAAWGGFAFYSQENLFGGVLIIGFLLGLAVAGRLLALRDGIVGGLLLCCGFAAVWLPVLLFYLQSGRLGEAAHNYFLVPGRFMKGYSNTPYAGTLNDDPLAVAFYLTPVLALLVGAGAIFRTRPLRPAFPLSPERFLVAAAAFAYLAAYPSALLRSDAPHFQSTTFAVPVLMTLAIFGVRRLALRDRISRAGGVLAFSLPVLIVALVYWPSWSDAPARLSKLIRGRIASVPLAARDLPPLPSLPNTDPETVETARRFGPILARSPKSQPHIEILSRLKSIVGDDPVMVLVDVPYAKKPGREYTYEGFVYFLADLNAGPILMERSDMVAGQADLDRFLDHMERHLDELDWIVSLAEHSPEITRFKKGYPCFTMQTLTSQHVTLHLFGRGPSSCATTSGPSRGSK